MCRLLSQPCLQMQARLLGHHLCALLIGTCLQLQGDQEHYIFFSLPHVAVDSSGALGKIQRPGRAKVSSACGALGAALGELQGKGVVGLGEGGIAPLLAGSVQQLCVLAVAACTPGWLWKSCRERAYLARAKEVQPCCA